MLVAWGGGGGERARLGPSKHPFMPMGYASCTQTLCKPYVNQAPPERHISWLQTEAMQWDVGGLGRGRGEGARASGRDIQI